MADTIDPTRTDDAPLTTSKRHTAAIDAATDALIDKPAFGLFLPALLS